MKIAEISVRYGELRSTGYPSFSNKRIEVELGAILDHGEIPREVKERLHALARREVQMLFGDNVEPDVMGIPF